MNNERKESGLPVNYQNIIVLYNSIIFQFFILFYPFLFYWNLVLVRGYMEVH